MGWATRIENTAQLADAVNLMCNISVEDYKMYLARRANSIEDEALRVAVRAFSAEFGDALESIHKGVKEHIECVHFPPSSATHSSPVTRA